MCERLPKQYGQTDFDQGSFSTGSVWDSRFAYRNPDKMKSEDAALIICGGWTVWNALIGYDLKPTDHVGVVGIGGLGNFAIQFANKMGCEVTAFSATESKKADSLALGAHHFVNTNLPVGKRLKVARQINKLLVCTNAHIRWELLTRILVGKATMFPLQIPSDMASKLSVAHMPFPMKSINVVYSTIRRMDGMMLMISCWHLQRYITLSLFLRNFHLRKRD